MDGLGGGGGGKVCGWGGGRVWNTEAKTVSQPDYVKRGKTQPSTQCKACGTINISKYANNF